ncbi:hypothetical protein [Pseudomonas jessenii]|uniref:RiboL-PSP-HEPN domain-containing protein n=1 Tax=Pseudomonas jessenii TaxID=77298 RepID=A0A370S8W0_PSEJE|nr:hypothetical protein [Pseudomonas jessenii]RDL16216.1 hypothetical protein DEU51_11473 [Pseudomonas jessenii]
MNSIDQDLADIRRLTRIALPASHTYLYRLGVALYCFASISSFMAEVICYMDPRQNRTDLETKMGGQLLSIFNQAVAGIEHSAPEAFTAGQETSQLFTSLNDERSDIIHAYPITDKTDNQILHRRKDKAQKYFEVTDEFLNNFIARLHQVNDGLYRIRSILRPL